MVGLAQYQRTDFNRIRFELLDSMVKFETYNERKYICGTPDTEYIVLFECQFYASTKTRYLESLLDKMTYWDFNNRFPYLQGTTNMEPAKLPSL